MKLTRLRDNIIVTTLLAAIIFMVDINLPLGIAGGVPYLLPVIVTLFANNYHYVTISAITFSVLVIFGYYLSPETLDSEHWKVLANRFLALFAIGIGALITRQLILTNERIKELKQAGVILESTPNAMLIVDYVGIIRLVNKQTEIYFGYKREELVGTSIEMLIPERLKSKYLKSLKTYFDSGVKRQIGAGNELYGLGKNGTEFPIDIGLNSINLKGEEMVLASIFDLTEQKLIQKRLETSNKDLEQFAYIATHDIKTPISNIDSFLNFLKADKDIQKERSTQAVEWIDKSVRRAQQTIEDLVMVTRSRKETQIELEEVELNEMFEEAKSLLLSQIEESNAVINADFSSYPIVCYNKIKTISLLQNLLGNAIKYRSPERQPNIELKTEVGESYICLSVKDNGLGVDMETDAEKVFGLFKRVHPKISGSGIGLYTTRQSIENAGGKIELESELGIGTTFKVYFKKYS